MWTVAARLQRSFNGIIVIIIIIVLVVVAACEIFTHKSEFLSEFTPDIALLRHCEFSGTLKISSFHRLKNVIPMREFAEVNSYDSRTVTRC